MKLFISLNILLVLCHKQGEGKVMISPPSVALTCNGDQLELTCTTSGSLLEWAFANSATARVYTKALSTTTEAREPLLVNSTRFTFSRLSAPNSLPLTSTLLIDRVSVGLNNTVVNCTDVGTSQTVSTTIKIITDSEDQIEDQALKTNVRYIEEQIEFDGVLVTLDWSQGNIFYSYFIDVIPPILLMFNGSTSVTMKVSFNTQYNVSILAEHLCGRNNNITIFSKVIYYSSCENPATDIDMLDENITVLGYREPAVEGTTVFFICPPELDHVGSRTSTCVSGGHWEPNPVEIKCKAEELKEQRPLNFVLSQVEKIALASATVFIVASIIFFIVGFLCRHYCYNENKLLSGTVLPPAPSMEVIPSPGDTQREGNVQELELKANVAYENVPMK